MPNIIPLLHCTDINKSVAFYTRVLDFSLEGKWPETGSPAFIVLTRKDDELHLSSHSGDGVNGSVVSVIVDDTDKLFRKYLKRGLKKSKKKESPVHQGPVDQTWGTREFYIDDPDGNTLRFIDR